MRIIHLIRSAEILHDKQSQLASLSLIISTISKLRSECRALDLLPKATVLLTHPSKSIRASASGMFELYLSQGTDSREANLTSNQLREALLETFRFVSYYC